MRLHVNVTACILSYVRKNVRVCAYGYFVSVCIHACVCMRFCVYLYTLMGLGVCWRACKYMYVCVRNIGQLVLT